MEYTHSTSGTMKCLLYNHTESTLKQRDESLVKQHSGIMRFFIDNLYCFMQSVLNGMCGYSRKAA